MSSITPTPSSTNPHPHKVRAKGNPNPNPKPKPNDRCISCASGKKYKICCRQKDQDAMFVLDQIRRTPYTSSQNDHAQECIRVASAWVPANYSWMDISDQLTTTNYMAYQQVYAYKSTVMIAHRSPLTEDIFACRLVRHPHLQARDPADIDIILLYNGGYRFIESNHLMQYKHSILQFIQLQDK